MTVAGVICGHNGEAVCGQVRRQMGIAAAVFTEPVGNLEDGPGRRIWGATRGRKCARRRRR